MLIKKLPKIYRILDYMLIPLMFVIGGFKKDSLQEHHGWHVRNIDPHFIDENKLVKADKSKLSKFKNHGLHFGLFHMPIFGGWKEYCVLEIEETTLPWHIGWVIKNRNYQINTLPIYDKKLRVLRGPDNAKWFALNSEGKQLNLKIVDKGILGDNKHPNIRLF